MKTLSKSDTKNDLLRIGKLVQETGEPISTIQFWTRKGLLQVKNTTPSGYFLYDPSMINRARTIRKLQNDKRLTISELQERFKRG